MRCSPATLLHTLCKKYLFQRTISIDIDEDILENIYAYSEPEPKNHKLGTIF